MRIVLAVLLVFTFTVAFTIAILTGTSTGAAVAVSLALSLAFVFALSLVAIVGSLVMTTSTKEVRLTVAAPRERVYEAISDPRHLLRWTPALAAVDLVAGEPGALGSRSRMRMVNGIVVESEVLAAEPPSRLVVRSRNISSWPQRSASSVTENTLVVTPKGTELRARRRLRAPLIQRLFMRLGRASSERLANWVNERMRADIEAAARVEQG